MALKEFFNQIRTISVNWPNPQTAFLYKTSNVMAGEPD